MNLKSYLEEQVVYIIGPLRTEFLSLFLLVDIIYSFCFLLVFIQFAFWLTTAGIIVGAVFTFFLMYSYLKARKIF